MAIFSYFKSSSKKVAYLTLFILVFNLLRCASVRPISGGEKDTDPPIPIALDPPNTTTNFRSRTIQITFNEYIQIKNYRKELIITPFVKDYTLTSKRRRAVLKFNEPLLDSTTYIINFRSSVVDFNEKNPAKNIQYVFSRGPIIDSLTLHGLLKNPLTLEPVKEGLALLFPTDDTLQVRAGNPRYIASVDTLGNFTFQNIKAGYYYLYGLEEKDANYRYNSDQEKIGFLKDSIYIDTSHVHLTLPLLQYDNIDFKFLKANSYRQYVRLNYNQKLKHYELSWEGDSSIVPGVDLDSIKHQTTEKYIQLYNFHDRFIKDTLALTVIAQNYLGDYDTSNVKVKFNKPKRNKKEKKETWSGNFEILPQGDLAPDDSIELKFKSNKPIILYDSMCLFEVRSRDTTTNAFKLSTDSISFDSLVVLQNKPQATFTDSTNTLTLDSLVLQIIDTLEKHYRIEISEPTLKDTTVYDTLLLPYPARPNFNYTEFTFPKFTYKPKTTLIIKAATFISIDKDSSEVRSFTFKFKEQNDYGLIAGKVLSPKAHIIVQLLDEKNEVVRSSVGKTFSFDYIKPGKKYIRLVEDLNQNGEWDKGRFLTREIPEPTFFFSEEIKLKANWEIKDIVVTWKP